MAYNALLECGVVLRAAENIGHNLAEDGAAAKELHHASGDHGAEESAAIEAAHDARGEFEFTRESSADPVSVHLGIAFGDGFAEKFTGAHGVKQTFSGERINERGGVAYQSPIPANHGALRECWNLRRGKDVAVEARGFQGKLLLADESLQVCTQFGLIVRSHAATDADRQMIAAREGPDVAVEAREKLDDDGIGGLRNEVALRDFQLLFLQRAGFREKLIACSGGQHQKISGMPFALDRVARLFT